MPKTAKAKHPYIVSEPLISGGNSVISGSRVRVIDIAIEYDRLGMSPDEIANAHPHLNLEEIHDALSFYYENSEAFDVDIKRRNEIVNKLSGKYPSKLKSAIG